MGHSPLSLSSSGYHHGQIDDFRIYDRVLSAAEVQTLAYRTPVAINDVYGTAANQQISVAAPGVLSNDSFALGITITAILDTNVSNGTLAVIVYRLKVLLV